MRITFCSSATATLLTTLLLVVPGRATAAGDNVLVCNHFHQTVYIALGYQSDNGWNSVGWWGVASGHCAPFTVPYQQFWFRAETAWTDLADGGKVRHDWGGQKKLYVAETGGFRYAQADREHDNSRLAGFESSPTWVGDGFIRDRIMISSDGKNTIQTVGPNALNSE